MTGEEVMLRVCSITLVAMITAAASAWAQGAGANLAEAAKKEGRVVVYSTTDAASANPLLKDFAALYPGITVDYTDMNSTEVYSRFIAEVAAGTGTADVVWSAAMDLQLKLAADGNAAIYASSEIPSLPKWAVWENKAYGTTYEPITFVYNKRLVPPSDVPQDHAALLTLLTTKPDAYRGKITAYDPEKSVGYLFDNEDIKYFPQAWDLFRAFGKVGARLYPAAGIMMERVTSGEHTIAYGVFGSYALARSKKVPNLGIIMPKDYTLVMSRVAFVSAKAKNPNAARLFLDYLLSKRGQNVIANAADLYSLRDDVTGEATVAGVRALIGDKARPVAIDRELLANLDASKRLEFIKKWQAAMKGQ
jgi:iron(III) transport system substrate-binding protein